MKDALLKNECWHLLCHRSELPNNNDYIRLSWLDEDLVIFNDAGQLTVFDNLCPHRGTRFFVDRQGNAPALCPYHGWRYREGKVHVARKEKFSGCDLSAIQINRYSTAWVGDFLFAAIAPRRSLAEQLAGVERVLERMSFDIDGLHDFNAQSFECNWRILIENALEPYHVDMVHPGSLGTLKLTDGRNDYFGPNSIWWSDIGNARAARQLDALGRFFKLNAQYAGYMSVYVFPFAMISSTYGYSYSLQQFMPSEDANRTHFTSRLLLAKSRDAESKSALASFFDSSARVNRQVFDEDYNICRRVSSAALNWSRPNVFASTEEKIVHFRHSLQNF